ncbi:MAG: hypothetical protein JXO22_04395, partial [Phycisphaerae bacterium]|nr:hypothetical protein [Phycisphaerae bacterium]
AEIIAAVRAAAGQARRWYARPILLWQATAACLVLCTATWLLSGVGQPSTVGDSSTASEAGGVVIDLDEPLFPDVSSSPDRMDVSRWRVCISQVTE